MRPFFRTIITLLLLLSPCALYASEEEGANVSSFDSAYESATTFLKELAAKAGLTEENQETLDEIFSSIKNTLDDPNPASKVQVEGKTKQQWDNFNSSSPEIEERNRKLQEENQKRIDNM